ncbi:lysylphosphatidylglycerol synthase transmembrane domain-containing protein [Natranaerobius thermophilus]|uniref:Phosphatidylglycerol lysyltransferase n=1 Tax=Natranaerobius thermophilus (strain ATCC BAA-1301 / DSM 18059 / JW/NM-WN-LF) TaxID=457570 RepID=B2A2W2_NATTJ|nr:lysylphosphatidylglycerol synthase transmembrane domain-containing protein [Natranaerobius thermophilus]ACB86330.1 conserved hypothetical protein [Natranaerobius thermophilus JW/NM-WN-LF]
MKKPFLFIFGILVITLVVVYIGWEEIYLVLNRMEAAQIMIMALLQVFTMSLTTLIWYYLLKQKTNMVSYSKVFSINLAGKFVESVTPSVKVGGEGLKVYLMKKSTALTYQELMAVTVVTKFFSLLPFLVITFITLSYALMFLSLPTIVYLAFIGLVLFFILFFIFFNYSAIYEHFYPKVSGKSFINKPVIEKLLTKCQKVHRFLSQASMESNSLVTRPVQRGLLFCIGALVWASYPLKVYLVATMLGFDINPIIAVIATYTAYLVSMIPLLPGGLATFEGSMALVLTIGGLSSPESLSVALMTRAFTFWLPLIISAFITGYYVRTTGAEASNN